MARRLCKAITLVLDLRFHFVFESLRFFFSYPTRGPLGRALIFVYTHYVHKFWAQLPEISSSSVFQGMIFAGGSSSRSRHGVARLLVHRMWHSGRARHVLLHLWAGTGTGTAVELLPFRVAHVRWPAGNV
jgi:hypothetical protein